MIESTVMSEEPRQGAPPSASKWRIASAVLAISLAVSGALNAYLYARLCVEAKELDKLVVASSVGYVALYYADRDVQISLSGSKFNYSLTVYYRGKRVLNATSRRGVPPVTSAVFLDVYVVALVIKYEPSHIAYTFYVPRSLRFPKRASLEYIARNWEAIIGGRIARV